MLTRFIRKTLTLLSLITLCTTAGAAQCWDEYKSRFLNSDGAIIDTGNNKMSHSEGQSYGLIFSLYFDDKESFEKILNWTDANLFNEEKGLYSWAYKRNEKNPVADKNNATDGDFMICWALIEAGKKWNNVEYIRKGEKLASTIMNTLIVEFAKTMVVLPGLKTFLDKNSVIINPSYYIWPAFSGLFRHTYMKKWQKIENDGKKIITSVKDTKEKITPDWLKMNLSGEVEVSEKWPARSSYDAIRVPLYLFWENENAPELQVWRDYFKAFPADKTPAYTDVISGEKAGYMMTSGLLNVRNLVMGQRIDEPVLTEKDDYFNCSLSILSYLAANHAFLKAE